MIFSMGSNSGFAADAPAHSSLFDSVSVRYNAIVLGIDFPYYTQQMRIQTMTDLLRSIQSDYSLLLYKQHTLGVDVEKLGEAALSAENAIPDVYDEPTQAKENLEFLDRARALVSNFKDSHFYLNAAQPPSSVALGIDVTQIQGKFVVSTITGMLLKDQKSQKDYSGEISIGDELVSIDGKNPEELVRGLENYIPGSSEAFRQSFAARSMTQRDFQLPEKGTAEVVLKHQGKTVSLSLPWYAIATRRSDEAAVFKKLGIFIVNQDTISTVKPAGAETLYKNAQWETAIQGLQNEMDFVDATDPTSTVVKFGVLGAPSNSAAFIQIQSFDVASVVDAASLNPPAPSASPSPGASPAPAAQPTVLSFPVLMKVLVTVAKNANLPLILDIRNNPGGNPDYSAAVLSALTPTGQQYAPLSEMYRITELAWETEDAMSMKGLTDPAELAVQKATDQAFRDAIAKKRDYSEVMPAAPIMADDDVGGFSGNVVALTSPNCVSACDIMAILLKSSGRAKLIGQPTNGTGAGFSSSFAIPDWTDTNHILTAKVPNFIFGRPLKAGESPATVDIESIEAENRPTQPDIAYEPDLNDVTSGNADLIQSALKQLASEAPAPVSVVRLPSQ